MKSKGWLTIEKIIQKCGETPHNKRGVLKVLG